MGINDIITFFKLWKFDTVLMWGENLHIFLHDSSHSPFRHKGSLNRILSPVRVHCTEILTKRNYVILFFLLQISFKFWLSYSWLRFTVYGATPTNVLHTPANELKLHIFCWHFLPCKHISDVAEDQTWVGPLVAMMFVLAIRSFLIWRLFFWL